MSPKRMVVTLGEQFGRLTVTSDEGVVAGKTSAKCLCSCGNTVTVPLTRLRSGRTTSCGCYQKECASTLHRKTLDVGSRFGRLVVVKDLGGVFGTTRAECICDCGHKVVVTAKHLRSGVTTSCGCYGKEMAIASRRKHGLSRSPEYDTWCHMKRRCLIPKDKNYYNYGGRGISVYPEWVSSFSAFLSSVGNRPSEFHSLDRIDVNGNYEPGNVRWATVDVQANNKRNNVNVTSNGITRTITEWCRELHLNANVVRYRITCGLTPYEAVFLGYPRTKVRRESLNWRGAGNRKARAVAKTDAEGSK